MDGLMLDTESLAKHVWHQASLNLGFPLSDDIYLNYIGRTDEDCERDLIRRFGTAFPLDEFRVRTIQLWKRKVAREGIRTKPGLIELLSLLDDRGIPTAVATSSQSTFARSKLRRAGLSSRFDIVVTGDQVANGKPAPDLFLEAARRLNVDSRHCVALEDSEAGVIAASRAGMIPIMIPDLKSPSDDARRTAFRVLASLDEAGELIAGLLSEPDGSSDR
jgi:HAD superfamily hydrolase (TIGR01509 family)